MSNVKVKCPTCGTYATGKIHLFKSTITCPTCGGSINPKKDSNIVVTCPECGQNVIFDTRNPETQTCPVCKTSLASYMIMDIEVECPNCHMYQLVKNNETVHTCPICDMVFNVKEAKAKKESATKTASVITVPYENKNVIWVHPETTFPYASQVIVPEGYTALILRNGRCAAASKPGNYLLSDSLKSLGDQLKDAVFNTNDQVSVQIIFVKNIIDSTFTWTKEKIDVPDNSGGVAGSLGFGGTIRLKVTDAIKLAEFAGFKNTTVSDLVGVGQPVYDKVCSECFNEGYRVFLAAVFNNGYTFQSLTMNRPLFEGDIQREVDRKLEDLGLRTAAFTLGFVTFTESESASIANRIRAYIEKPFEWMSDNQRLTMDDSIFADVHFGGNIKLRLSDENRFFGRSEIREWLSHGVREDALKEYFSGLAAVSANDVLTTCIQKQISENRINIQDLSGLHPILKDEALALEKDFFRGYGLDVEQFYFKVKDRKNSPSLEKLIAANKYKTDKTIDTNTLKFDNDNEVTIHESIANRDIGISSIDINKETELTKLVGRRTQNAIERMVQEQSVADVEELINRQSYIKHQDWKEADEQRNHKRTLQQYHNSGEEESALHYLNQQIIKDQAEELRTRWEQQSRLDHDQLQQYIRMNDLRDDASRGRFIKDRDLYYKVNQGDAENERIVNSIFRKIAESDLEMSEKIDNYARVFDNMLEDDKLRHFIDWSKAGNSLLYDKKHLQNILSEEELKILEDAQQRADERAEKTKDADFFRSLKQQELNLAYEMEKLKMKYDAESRESDNVQDLHNKQLEIDKLKMMLAHYERLDDNDVKRLGIREVNNTIRAKAESEFKAEYAKSEREVSEKREQDRLDREERYSKRADELLTKMLAIQEALKKLGLENERVYIQEHAGVAKAEAEASRINSAEIDKLIKELKEMANAINRHSSSGFWRPSTIGGEGAFTSQPGTRRCPHCGYVIPENYRVICPNCRQYI